jgi:carboxyl-terminal processing protease
MLPVPSSPLRSFFRLALTACFAVLPLAEAQALAKIKPLQPTEEQIDVTPVIVSNLNSRHYLKLKLDDALSEQLFEAYIDNLDPARAFFLQSDIDRLSKLSLQLDDELRKGSVDSGYEIYNTYHRRVVRRFEKVVDILQNDYDSFTFDGDDSLYIGEEKAPWPANKKAADELWHKRIKHSILNLKITDKADDEIQELLLKRYKNSLNQARQLRPEDVYEGYINTYASMYDPHTNYFSPRSLENFNIRMRLSLEGIGAVLSQEDEYTKVVKLIKGGPAERQAGLKRNDKIVAVGQDLDDELVNVVGWRLDEVVDLIRGQRDSWVRLEVLSTTSDDPQKTRIINIRRGKVELEEEIASKKIIEVERDGQMRKVGVIEIPTFYFDYEAYRRNEKDFRSTTRDVTRLMQELEEEQVEGIVIDLRDNGGGSLLEVNRLIWLFIEKGPTVQIRHANNRVTSEDKPMRSAYFQQPMVVLTNRNSASASEIFAGAMQDYQRAIIVGGRSFGKGTVQALTPLPHGQLKITQSKYYRISGASTQHRGVIPDIKFPVIYDPEEVGESTLKEAMVWDTIAPLKHDYYGNLDTTIKGELNQRHVERSQDNPDFIYLKDQLAMRQQARAKDSITLNEAARLAERVQLRDQRLAIENQRRKAKGQELLASLEELEKEEEAAAEDNEEEPASNPEDDIYMGEAAEILLDMSQLNSAVAKTSKRASSASYSQHTQRAL